ncbi:platelet endothelial cell adhesion molecule isoform 2-T2 [Pholidichthys leucotaenia]
MFTLLLFILGFCLRSECNDFILGQPRLYGPSEALVNEVQYFQCEVPNHSMIDAILLKIVKEDGKMLGEMTSLKGEVANIPLYIKPLYEGYLKCVASAQNNSEINATVSYRHYLKVIVPVKDAAIIYSGPDEFFEGKTLELRCQLGAGNHVSYKWLHNGQTISQSPFHHMADDRLRIYRTTSKDSGFYMCQARNIFNKTVYISNSSEVIITVKDLVSSPDISFIILKEDSGNYSALVTCQSNRGTTPITFSLYNRAQLVTNATSKERHTAFKVPVVMEQHLGWLQCQAENGDETTYSQWLPLHVVPVGGPVEMSYDYDIGENYAVVGLRFYCKAAKGTHPQYQWFLNETLLQARGSFFYVDDQPPVQSVLLLSVGRSSAGMYHCKVSDNFDNTTAISSQRRYMDKEVVNRLPVLVVAIVFGCFTMLILLVFSCCLIGVLFRRKEYGKVSLLTLVKERNVAAYEDEMDLFAYSEDTDVMKTARGDEFDQASEASVDEWPQIQGKKTLEEEDMLAF